MLGVAGSLFIALGLFAAAAAKKAPRYDGHWWLSVSEDEQSGFLNGYADCYIYEYKGQAHFSGSAEGYQEKISHLYRTGPVSDLAVSVGKVLRGFRDRPGQRTGPGGGQTIKGPHGYFRGLYWGALYDGGTSGQLGYVEGYLDCHARLDHNKGGAFSKQPSDYVTLMNRWYGFIPHNEGYLLKRETLPIADVLFKFRDRPQRPKPARPRP